jgi:hypothetical protein
MLISILKKYVGIILLGITLTVGLFTYKTYGISWDEQEQRHIGMFSYTYLVHGDPAMHYYWNRNYGVAFELPLIILERILNLHDTRDIYLMRHLVSHLFFLFSAFCLFLLIDYLYKNKLLATIGFLMLVLNPVIYGHSFFNSKDVPLLSMYIICFLLTAVAFNNAKYKYYILLGIACALLINIRIMGSLMVASVCLFFLADYFNPAGNKKQTARFFLTFLVTTLLVLYASWPYLYNNPVGNIIDAFKGASNHWPGIDLFNGRLLAGSEVSMAYTFVWFSISNPIIYLLAGMFGILLLVICLFKNFSKYLSDKKERNNLAYLIIFILPILLVIILHSRLYDGWRLMYFLYAPFILLAIYGLNYLLKTKLKMPVIIVIAAGIASTSFYMIQNFPFGYVYFNNLVSDNEPEKLRKTWELDYWGTSYKQALEYILENDKSQKIDIAVANPPGQMNLMILKPEERTRLNLVTDNPEYFLTSYRFHPEDYSYPASQVYYNIKVLNSSIMTVYKLR